MGVNEMKLKLVHIKGIEDDLSDHIFLRNGETEIPNNDEKGDFLSSYNEDFPTKTDVFKSNHLTISKNKNKIFIKVSVKDEKGASLYVVYQFEIGSLDEQEIEDILSTIKKYTNRYNRKIVDEEKTLETLKEELSKIRDKEIKKEHISNGLIAAGIIVALATYLSVKNIPLSLLGVLIIVIGIVNKFKK